MIKNNAVTKTHVVVDLGPSTIIVLSEILLIIIKLMEYINYSWEVILLPILLVIAGSTIILLSTLFKMLKNHIF
jgi:hypothetical protein